MHRNRSLEAPPALSPQASAVTASIILSLLAGGGFGWWAGRRRQEAQALEAYRQRVLSSERRLRRAWPEGRPRLGRVAYMPTASERTRADMDEESR